MDGSRIVDDTQLTGAPAVRLRPEVRVAAKDAYHERLSVRWAAFAALVGPVVMAICMAVEPSPADPDAPVPLYASMLGFAYIVALTGAAVTGVRRLATALTWAAAGSALAVVLAITCPASGHHVGIGPWWGLQMVVTTGALAACGAGLRRHA